MKIGDGEDKIADYYFKGESDVSNMSVLTTRRLIVVYGNAEESYPLSKITAVKTIFNRSWLLVIVGLFIAVPTALAALGGIARIASEPAPFFGTLLVAAIAGGVAYLGWKGKTRLLIKQMGGEKYYVVRGKDSRLIDFMESVNAKLA